MATIIRGDDDFNTNNIATQTELNSSISALPEPVGESQSWTNVTSSRALGTTYTNTTGRTIVAAVTSHDHSNYAYLYGYVDDLYIQETQVENDYHGAATTYQLLIVPAGSTYRVNAGSSTPLQTWYELR